MMMLFVWAACCVIAIVGFFLFWDAVDALGKTREWHHAYVGLPLVVQPWFWWLWPIGLWILLDDTYQHHRQRREPYYLSPLHRMYERVYRWVNAE